MADSFLTVEDGEVMVNINCRFHHAHISLKQYNAIKKLRLAPSRDDDFDPTPF